MAVPVAWSPSFFDSSPSPAAGHQYALLILNQPFSFPLLRTLWKASSWRCCADGGGNRLHDLLRDMEGAEGCELDQRKL